MGPLAQSLFVLKPFSGQVSWSSLGAGPFYIHTHSLFLVSAALTGPYCEPRSPFSCGEPPMPSPRSQKAPTPRHREQGRPAGMEVRGSKQ